MADRKQRPDATCEKEERVTVQGPVKKQQPDGMSQGGGGVCLGVARFRGRTRVSGKRPEANRHCQLNPWYREYTPLATQWTKCLEM